MLRYMILLAAIVFWPYSAKANIIEFQCSWDNSKPITITVDDKTMKAFRDDGGKNYTVVKITEYAVWMIIDEPENAFSAALQMIQRGADNSIDDPRPYKGRKWLDATISTTGEVSPIAGGTCWENK